MITYDSQLYNRFFCFNFTAIIRAVSYNPGRGMYCIIKQDYSKISVIHFTVIPIVFSNNGIGSNLKRNTAVSLWSRPEFYTTFVCEAGPQCHTTYACESCPQFPYQICLRSLPKFHITYFYFEIKMFSQFLCNNLVLVDRKTQSDNRTRGLRVILGVYLCSFYMHYFLTINPFFMIRVLDYIRCIYLLASRELICNVADFTTI